MQLLKTLTNPQTPIFVTLFKTQADAIRNAGADAVHLDAWANADTLIAAVKQIRPSKPLLFATLAFDGSDDMDAVDTTNQIGEDLERAGIKIGSAIDTARILAKERAGATISGDDIRAAVSSDLKSLESIEKKTVSPISAAQFLRKSFDSEINNLDAFRNLKTGFDEIDSNLTIYPGLAALTGRTSLGKTSFCVQLADQMAESGYHVLYFALEQPPVDLVTKSLARLLEIDAHAREKTNIDIQNGEDIPALWPVRKKYMRGAGANLHYVPGSFEMTAADIFAITRQFEAEYFCKPVVIVDYLQLIAAPQDPAGRRMDETAKVDYNIKSLKTLSREDGLFVLAISNMARSKYLDRISEESYKMTGAIEHTCDYLFGLQLSIMEAKDFYKTPGAAGVPERERLCDIELSRTKRREVFKCIKQRKGIKVFNAFLVYEADHDYFYKGESDPDKILAEAKGETISQEPTGKTTKQNTKTQKKGTIKGGEWNQDDLPY